MGSRYSLVSIILPTDELLFEYRPCEPLLDLVNVQQQCDAVTLTGLLEYTLLQWAACTSQPWQHFASLPRCPQDAVIQYLMSDFLTESHLRNLSGDDARAITQVVLMFAMDIFRTIIHPIEKMDLSDYQLETLEVAPWLGQSMVLRVVTN